MRQAYKKHLIVIGAYLGLAFVMALPLLGSIGTHFAGSGGDPWQTIWRFENNAELESLGDEFFGSGEPRLVNLSVWPWMWLHVFFGQPLTYNLVWLASFVLSGYGMFLLVRWIFGREVPAFLAGVYYMFLPYHVAHAMGHFGAMQTQWLPFIVLLLLVWLRQPDIWKTLALTVLLIIQAWSEHHYMLWLLLFGLWWVLFNWQELKDFLFKKGGLKYIVVLGMLLFFFVVLPYMPTIKVAAQADNTLVLGQEQTIRFSADLFSYIVPASFHTIWGDAAYTLFASSFTGNIAEATQYLGLLPLILVLFFHQEIPRRQKIFWMTVAVLFLIVSLGPRLHILGRVLEVPLPYGLVDSWPVFSVVRAVARASVMVGLAGAVLLGGVLSRQLRGSGRTVAVLLVILLEFMFLPVPLQSAELPGVYEAVKKLPGRAIVEIPAATNYTAASKALVATRQHGKEVVGNIALERAQAPEDFIEARSLPVLRQLLYLRTTAILEERQEFFAQGLVETLPDVLRYLDAQAVLLHTDSVSTAQTKAVRHLLEDGLGLEAQDYGDALLYVINLSENVWTSDGVFMARDGRWQNVGFDSKRDSVFAEIFGEASVKLYNVTDEEKKVALSFTFAPESGGNMLVKQDEREVARYNSEGGRGGEVVLMLSPGESTVSFKSLSADKVIIQNPQLKVQ